MATITKNLSAYDKSIIPSAETFCFGIVVSKWNSNITESLCKGALETLLDLGAKRENIKIWYVPGSFELIFAANKICATQNLDALITIGSVIRGETAHFDYVCQGVTQGIKDVNIKYNTPTIFCVLTDDTQEQAESRSGGRFGNKGTEAAVVAVEMVALNKALT